MNTLSEHVEFEVGYEYIAIVNLFLFCCFFAALQPIILIIAVFGMVAIYWANKFCLFNRCKRPIPGNKTINTAMYTLIYLGPLFFSLGNFCWSHFFEDGFISIAPNLIASIIAFIIFLIPYRFIVIRCMGENVEDNMFYEENRIFFPSEYDRLNPETSKAAVEEYIEFVNTYKNNLKNKDES